MEYLISEIKKDSEKIIVGSLGNIVTVCDGFMAGSAEYIRIILVVRMNCVGTTRSLASQVYKEQWEN